MKTLLIAALVAVAFASGAALSDDTAMKGMDKHDGKDTGAAKRAATHQASGVVKKLDAGRLLATIAHDPVKSLNWPGMTMDFAVADKALLSKLKVGQKVNFELELRGNEYVIVAVN